MISKKQSFDSCFEVFLADTPKSRDIHYNIRYQVYCDEMGFEDKEAFPRQMEFDEWDQHSVHFMVRHRYTGQWLGALRLVKEHGGLLPFENKCATDEPISTEQYQQAIEISRLCVLKEARRFAPRSFEHQDSTAADSELKASNVRYLHSLRNQSRSIMWGLYRAAVNYSARNGIKHWFILVTPSLAYAVKKEGFEMCQVGGGCDHRGQRIPYMLDVEKILANPFWENDYKADYRYFSELEDRRDARRHSPMQGVEKILAHYPFRENDTKRDYLYHPELEERHDALRQWA